MGRPFVCILDDVNESQLTLSLRRTLGLVKVRKSELGSGVGSWIVCRATLIVAFST
jgi:hypothetical protein